MIKITKNTLTGYKLNDGCWNCKHVDRNEVASGIYPICTAYTNKFMVDNYGICGAWESITKLPSER
jgi:hypothetical protein